MDRNTAYTADSIYDGYLSPGAGEGSSGPRYSQSASTISGTTDHHLSLAPPVPRANNGRLTAMSVADTASVYTNATTPYERWSLEQGLLGSDQQQQHQQQFRSSADAYSSPSPPPQISTHRPPNSPSLNDLRHMKSNSSLRQDPISPTSATSLQPFKALTPVAPSPSPVPNQYPRRHFSRPFRPEESLNVDNQAPAITTPKIMVHRFSASTPNAYGGADFSPAMTNNNDNEDKDDARSSTYSSDLGRFPDPSHLRRRSLPNNSFGGSGNRQSEDGTSLRSVKQALAARHGKADSIAGLSIIESEDERFADEQASQRRRSSRPLSASEPYPFTSRQHGYGSTSMNMNTLKTISPKPSSRFSEDEKRNFGTMSSNNNDYHSTAWRLFGRAPTPSPMWAHESEKKKGMAPINTKGKSSQKSRKRLMLVLLGLLVLALAGAGTGIGVWRNNVAKDQARQNSLAAKDAAGDSGSSATESSSDSDAGAATATTDAASATSTGRNPTAVPGSGGQGGYYNLLAFGDSYGDNGHTRTSDLESTLRTDPYDGGRSTNGKIYQEYLVSLLGPTANTSATIFNYAYNGAAMNNSITSLNSPDMPQQVVTYLGQRDGGNATVQSASATKTLVTIFTGMEQIINVWQAAIAQTDTAPATLAIPKVQAMISTLKTTMSWLIPDGANSTTSPDFAFISLPAGDILPEAASLSNGNTEYVTLLKNMTTTYNSGLSEVAASLNQTKTYVYDGQSLFEKVYSDSSKYSITNITSSCLQDSCGNSTTYMWYDGLNPSTELHKLIAQRLASLVLSG